MEFDPVISIDMVTENDKIRQQRLANNTMFYVQTKKSLYKRLSQLSYSSTVTQSHQHQ